MGYYHEQKPPDSEEGPGCLDAIVITRVVFGLLFWPVAALILVVVDIGLIFYFFTLHPALALIPASITGLALWLFARWEQRHDRPPVPDDDVTRLSR